MTSSAGITYDACNHGPAMARPLDTGGSGPAYLGPTVMFQAVPEPATWE